MCIIFHFFIFINSYCPRFLWAMACSSSRKFERPVIKDIVGEIDFVSQKFLRLLSPKLEPGSFIQISPVMASILFPKIDVCKRLPNFESEYRMGDSMKMDLFASDDDKFHFIPLQVSAILRERQDGWHLNTVGMIINVSELQGITIRSAHIPVDIVCDYSNLNVPPDCCVSIGTVVVFEAIHSPKSEDTSVQGNYYCASARVLHPTVLDVDFPYYRDAVGQAVIDGATRQMCVRFHFDEMVPQRFLPFDRQLPILDGAFYGGKAPGKTLLDNFVLCFICPRRPFTTPESDFEIIKLDPPNESFVVPHSYFSQSDTDGRGDCFERITVHRSSQRADCETYNQKINGNTKEAFCFFVERGELEDVIRFICTYPHYAMILLEQMGMESISHV